MEWNELFATEYAERCRVMETRSDPEVKNRTFSIIPFVLSIRRGRKAPNPCCYGASVFQSSVIGKNWFRESVCVMRNISR